MKFGNKFLLQCQTVSVLLLGGAAALMPMQSQAATVTLTDGAALARIDTGSSAGMYEWSINGINQLNNQWFWFRNGSAGPQYSIESGAISTTATYVPGGNHLNVLYNHGAFGIEVDYTLSDTGPGQSRIDESIRLHNYSGGTLNFYFFQYSDFNLGTAAGDTLVMDAQNALQQEGSIAIAEGILDPNATRFEANTVGGAGSTLSRLMNDSGVALNNVDNASGDVTWAYEWNFLIGAGQTQDILKNKGLTITLIPEPSSMAILATGLAAWALVRRRQRP